VNFLNLVAVALCLLTAFTYFAAHNVALACVWLMFAALYTHILLSKENHNG